ncbi:DUF1127 domain-containing protein [Rhodobacteraceae bacterium HSP-20]|uniref:DUF1127 domain-containing protein n=1 Tax=Paragemmobacter amnigenus TaxID=2852097 RepID=A0ABS6J8K9_9RHOB|nr:DUF1127 domain-containing protein [Rhodobacter amnigenus]MBU9699586.1 DUF1127 domain-containing protein [Rhodobacter amnigenus]MBV4390813.1 DUF1127 domain-containing protein [Rhodobacter amnigenus]
MLTRLRAFLDRWHQLKAIETLTDRDLDDLGMTRAQLEAFATMRPDVPDRVARMAAIFGIPESDLKANYADYLELLGTCSHCADRAACSLLLHSGDLARPRDATFCPNAPVYAERGHVAA